MPRVRMSPAWFGGLDVTDDNEWIDTEQRGLVLRIRRGRLVWFVRYVFEGQARRYRLGEHPSLGLSAARRLASVVRGRAAAGDDPQQERRTKREDARQRRLGETVGGALASWLKDGKQGPLGRWRGGLDGGSARASLPHIRRLERMLGKKLLSEVSRKEIERVVMASEAPATRNRALCALRGFLGWAIRNGLVEKDPTSGLRKEHETARTRVLADDEIRTLINAFDQTRYGRALRLLFLTALRRDEVLGLKWSWIDMEKGVLTIPPEAEKSGRVRDELRRAGLPPQAVALLAEQRSSLFAEGVRSEYVFATSTGERPQPDSLKPILYRLRGRRSNGLPPSKDKRAKKRIAVLGDDVTVHDIRRTVADALLNRIGAPPWIVDHVVLGHARPKLLRTYMPTLPLGEAREVLRRWGNELDRILRSDGGLKVSHDVTGLEAGTPATRREPTRDSAIP
jgi:integrase